MNFPPMTWEERLKLIDTIKRDQAFWQGQKVHNQGTLRFVVWHGAPPSTTAIKR